MTVTDRTRLSAADLNKLWTATRRRRGEHLRSIVLGWLSRRAGTNLNVQRVEHTAIGEAP